MHCIVCSNYIIAGSSACPFSWLVSHVTSILMCISVLYVSCVVYVFCVLMCFLCFTVFCMFSRVRCIFLSFQCFGVFYVLYISCCFHVLFVLTKGKTDSSTETHRALQNTGSTGRNKHNQQIQENIKNSRQTQRKE